MPELAGGRVVSEHSHRIRDVERRDLLYVSRRRQKERFRFLTRRGRPSSGGLEVDTVRVSKYYVSPTVYGRSQQSMSSPSGRLPHCTRRLTHGWFMSVCRTSRPRVL